MRRSNSSITKGTNATSIGFSFLLFSAEISHVMRCQRISLHCIDKTLPILAPVIKLTNIQS